MSKRRRGFPSEKQVKRGVRIVHGDKLLEEKLGRNDLCPCGSGKRSRRAACHEAAFDGVNRHDFFQRMNNKCSHSSWTFGWRWHHDLFITLPSRIEHKCRGDRANSKVSRKGHTLRHSMTKSASFGD